jgi:hypothetical protein
MQGQQMQQFQAPEQQMPQQTADQLFKQFDVAQQRPQTNRQMVSQAMSGGLKAPQMGQPQLNLPQQAAMQTLSPAQQQAVAPIQQAQPTKQMAQQPQVAAQSTVMEQPWQILQKKPRNKLEQEEKKEARKEQHYIDKENKDFVDKIDKQGGLSAQIADINLDRLEKLIDTGKLTGPTMYNFRKKMETAGTAVGAGLGTAAGTIGGAALGSFFPGVGTAIGAGLGAGTLGGVGTAIGAMVTPKFVGSKEDQEFVKNALATFMPRMKDIFGSRIAIQEMQTFLDSIPSLSQTDEGKKAIIRNMKLTNRAYKYIKQVKDNVVERHGGYQPRDLVKIVEKEIEPMMAKFSSEFVGNIPQGIDLPEPESRASMESILES